MHMDLDRMRDIPDGWTRANMAMHDKFRTRIKLADQDILNILFHYYPDMLYELPCEWNYRVWQCSQVFKIYDEDTIAKPEIRLVLLLSLIEQ